MRVLFDNGTPRGLAAALHHHAISEARAHGWDTLRNESSSQPPSLQASTSS
jgi:hypothetical protein